jgi:hypothetical protein
MPARAGEGRRAARPNLAEPLLSVLEVVHTTCPLPTPPEYIRQLRQVRSAWLADAGRLAPRAVG